MNLVEAAESLENVPFEQLEKIANGNPDEAYRRYPKMMAIDEVIRRTADTKSYIAQLAAMNQPKKSVSENLIDDYKQLANINPQNMMMSPEDSVANPEEIMMNLQNSVMNNQMAGIPSEVGSMVDENVNPASSLRQDIVMPETMQMAASGGLVGYQEGGDTAERGIFGNIIDSVDTRSDENPSMTDITRMFLADKIFGVDPKTSYEIGQKGGLQNLKEDIVARYTDDEGNLDKSALATDAGIGVAGVAASRVVGPKISQGAVKYGPKVGKGLKSAGKSIFDFLTKKEITKKKKFLKSSKKGSKPVKEYPAGSPQAKLIQQSIENPKGSGVRSQIIRKNVKEKVFSPNRMLGVGGTGLASAALIQEFNESPESPNVIPKPFDDSSIITDDSGNLPTADTEEKGLLGISKEQGLNLTKLAALVGSSSNMKEFFTGLGGLAESIEEKESTEGLSEAQKDYYIAQTEKLGAETEALPLTAIRKDFAEMVEFYKALQQEGSEQSLNTAAGLLPTIKAYRNELAKAQGFSSTDAATNIQKNLEKSGITVS